MSTAQDIAAILLPNVPDLADSVDAEIVNIRGFLQHIAVVHNTMAHNILEQFTAHKADIDLNGATLTEASGVVATIRGELGGIGADMQNMKNLSMKDKKNMDTVP